MKSFVSKLKLCIYLYFSLIQAILGELPAESGSIVVNGTISFASQEPWLFTGTVRQNILFGSPMSKKRYRKVIKTCALERDLIIFSNGDKTVVGEKGSMLSGGQKARICLARAIYRKADIYLLDDPLSAVDAHVSRHLFEHCLRGFLKGSIIVLVTHQLQFMELADKIAIMNKGRISAIGDFETLKKTDLAFAKLLLRENKMSERSDSVHNEQDVLEKRKSGHSLRSCMQTDRKNSVSSMSSSSTDTMLEYSLDIKKPFEKCKTDTLLYIKYFEAIGCNTLFSVMIFFCILTQFLASVSDYFLAYW